MRPMFRVLIVIAVLIFLTWPFFVGRWIFEAECADRSGVHIDQSPDARSDGFYDYRLTQQQSLYGVSTNNFLQDVKDLIDERIAYFETDRRTTGWDMGEYKVAEMGSRFEMFFIADRGSQNCVYYNDGIVKFADSLPNDKCLASEQSDTIKSRYEIRASGYHHTDSRASTEIIDRMQNATVANFQSFNHYNPLNFNGNRERSCPRYADRGFSPHLKLVSMVFVDRLGQRKDLRQLEIEDDEKLNRLFGR